jgi:hypothetical protein
MMDAVSRWSLFGGGRLTVLHNEKLNIVVCTSSENFTKSIFCFFIVMLKSFFIV